MQILKAGVLYFALVFGAGFVLGAIRILWIVPRLAVSPKLSSRLGMGCVGLGLMLVAEFTLVLWLWGLSISEYFAARDPVSGTVYYVMLGVFCIMPLLVAPR